MGNTACKGYTDVFGKHGVWIGDHTGPASYVQGGETILASAVGNLRSLDFLVPEEETVSGNYSLQSVSPTTIGGIKQSGKLKWLYGPSNPLNPSNEADGVPVVVGPVSTTTSTVSAVTAGGAITITMANTLVPGNFVVLSAFTQLGALNGLMVQVQTATAAQFTATFGGVQAAVTSGADTTGKYQIVQVAPTNLLQLGTVAAITNSLSTGSLLTMTAANSFKPGQFVVIQGLTNGAKANGYTVQVLTASSTQFTAVWTGTSFSTAGDAGTATMLVTNGAAAIISSSPSMVITNSLATASSAGTAGVISLTSVQNLVPGNIGVVNGLTNGAAINGDILAVIATNLTNVLFKSNMINAGFTTAGDSGTFSILVTGVPTGSAEVVAGTNLSGESVRLLAVGG